MVTEARNITRLQGFPDVVFREHLCLFKFAWRILWHHLETVMDTFAHANHKGTIFFYFNTRTSHAHVVQVLVLPTVEASTSKTLHHKIKGLDTCASNIYGVPECILLTWLNHHYEEQYSILFPNSGRLSLVSYCDGTNIILTLQKSVSSVISRVLMLIWWMV